MHSTIRAMVFWLVVVLSAFLLWFFSIVRSGGGSHQLPIISYSAFLSQVESGNVTEVTIRKDGVTSKCRDASKCPAGDRFFTTMVPTCQDAMLQTLHQNKVEIVLAKEEKTNWLDWLTWLWR